MIKLDELTDGSISERDFIEKRLGISLYHYSPFRQSVRNLLMVTLVMFYDRICVEGEEEPTKKEIGPYVEFLLNHISGLDKDIGDYSKETLKILGNLNGFDDDFQFRCLNAIKRGCVWMRLGVLNELKPLDLSNNITALLEF